jgi:hypothetical protein
MNSIWSHRRLRFVVVAMATVVTGAALASAALAGLGALKLGPAAASQYPKKVTVCHRTHSKKHPWVQIRISTHALKAHLKHGDFVVDAGHPCPPTGAAAAAAAAKNKHHGKHSGKGKAKGKSGKSSAQAKGNGKSGKNSAQGTAKSGKSGVQAGSAQTKGKGKSGSAPGKAKNGKTSAPTKGKGKGANNSAPPKTNHPNNKGGNGNGKK